MRKRKKKEKEGGWKEEKKEKVKFKSLLGGNRHSHKHNIKKRADK